MVKKPPKKPVRKAKGLSDVPIVNPVGGSSFEISVRPVENGFIIRETTHGGGEYKTTERFSKTAPRLPSIGRDGPSSVGDERLSGAKIEFEN